MSQVFYLELESHRKLILLALADNANTRGRCWPSQKEIALKASVSVRRCRDHLHALDAEGWMTILSRGDGRGIVSEYLLNMERIRQEAERVRAIKAAKRDAASSFETGQKEDITAEKADVLSLKADAVAEKADTSELPNRQEPSSIEPSEEPGGTGRAAEPRPPRHDEFTQGYDSLEEIPGVQRESVEAYRLTRRMLAAGVSPEDFRLAASALASKWPGPKSRPYRNPWLTVYNWSLRDLEHRLNDTRGGRTRDGPTPARPSNGEPGRHPEEDHEKKQREANEWAERQRLSRAQHRGPTRLPQL